MLCDFKAQFVCKDSVDLKHIYYLFILPLLIYIKDICIKQKKIKQSSSQQSLIYKTIFHVSSFLLLFFFFPMGVFLISHITIKLSKIFSDL